MRILEVCCADLASLQAAVAGGAQRVELCQALSLDGLTPSAGMIRLAVESGITVHVLIRPREGDFVYSEAEMECMIHDIHLARELGAHGVVIGVLDKEGNVDEEKCRRLVAAAEGMHVTFHRAFDVCRDPMTAIRQIVDMGCDRLLTSGQAASAEAGIDMIRQLVETYGHAIKIMPGAGVNAQNAAHILNETGAMDIHGSLRRNGHTDVDIVRRTVATIS